VVGIRQSAAVNTVIVFIKVTIILLFIITCGPHIQLQNWTPFIPPSTGKVGEFGWTGIVAGAGVMFYAYLGFDALTTTAQETKMPARDVPISIIGSLLICTILYVLVSLVLTGVVNYKQLNVSAPVVFAIQRVGQRFLGRRRASNWERSLALAQAFWSHCWPNHALFTRWLKTDCCPEYLPRFILVFERRR
jgi:basic amino acid/polyamine antiporter, APA family